MENEEKESLGRRLRNWAIALGCICLIGAFVHSSTESKSYLEPVKLSYNNIIYYPLEGDSINVSQESQCLVISTEIEYNPDSSYLVVEMKDRPPVLYTNGMVNPEVSNQLVLYNSAGNPVVFTRIMGDSVLVLVERPHFIIFSKGKKCIKFEDLPSPN